MSKTTIEQKLLHARPHDAPVNQAFIKDTMRRVRGEATCETFVRALRTKNEPKQGSIRMKLRNLHKRFNALPRAAAVAIVVGAVMALGGIAYAAYHWIVPQVTVTNVTEQNDDNRRQYTIDSQCGNYMSGKSLKYELARGSTLTNDDVLKVFKNTCAYQAMGSFIDSRWVSNNGQEDMKRIKEGDPITIYQHDNTFVGSDGANPIFGLTFGRVTSVSAKELTIALSVYSIDNMATSGGVQAYQYHPGGKLVSRTLPLAPEVEVLENGAPKSLADVHVGDTIQVVTRTQNAAKYYSDIKQIALGAQKTFDTVGIIKTDIDPKYVAGLGDRSIVDAIASLNPCHNNSDYYCVFPPNQAPGPVYSVDDALDKDATKKNIQYRRKDAKDIQTHQLDGRIISIVGTHITLETRGKKQRFTVDLPYDAVTEYNNATPANKDLAQIAKLGVGVGDLMQVYYAQKSGEDVLAIKPGDISVFSVLVQTQPDGTFTKY